MLWPPSALDVNRSWRFIYLDIGARHVNSSVLPFRASYPGGLLFDLYAFEADPRFAQEYAHYPSISYIETAVSTFDGDCFFSSKSSLGAHLSIAATSVQNVPVHCLNFPRWLRQNTRPDDFVVAKMDIEGEEFRLIPALMAHSDTLRLLDELFIECHHEETFGNGPHLYAECLEMHRHLQSEGVWTHEWF